MRLTSGGTAPPALSLTPSQPLLPARHAATKRPVCTHDSPRPLQLPPWSSRSTPASQPPPPTTAAICRQGGRAPCGGLHVLMGRRQQCRTKCGPAASCLCFCGLATSARQHSAHDVCTTRPCPAPPLRPSATCTCWRASRAALTPWTWTPTSRSTCRWRLGWRRRQAALEGGHRQQRPASCGRWSASARCPGAACAGGGRGGGGREHAEAQAQSPRALPPTPKKKTHQHHNTLPPADSSPSCSLGRTAFTLHPCPGPVQGAGDVLSQYAAAGELGVGNGASVTFERVAPCLLPERDQVRARLPACWPASWAGQAHEGGREGGRQSMLMLKRSAARHSVPPPGGAGRGGARAGPAVLAPGAGVGGQGRQPGRAVQDADAVCPAQGGGAALCARPLRWAAWPPAHCVLALFSTIPCRRRPCLFVMCLGGSMPDWQAARWACMHVLAAVCCTAQHGGACIPRCTWIQQVPGPPHAARRRAVPAFTHVLPRRRRRRGRVGPG